MFAPGSILIQENFFYNTLKIRIMNIKKSYLGHIEPSYQELKKMGKTIFKSRMANVEEVIITAIEGGSNYWCLLDKDDIALSKKNLFEFGVRHKEIHYDFIDALFQQPDLYIRVYDSEFPDEEIGQLSQLNIFYGIGLAIYEYPEQFAQHFTLDYSGDCLSADTLFQLFTLGAVNFG
jgi:hypothetical protein|tara:strand:+ start:5126 stop:5656 length:531 start_codon:yes stop_codon:yes gene_type:complete